MNRWGLPESPLLAEACPRRKRPGWRRGRLAATASKGQGPWHSVSRAVAKDGQTIDVLRTEPRGPAAALRVLTKASRWHGSPATLPMDGRAAQAAASTRANAAHGPAMAIWQGQYGPHSVEQDQRGGQRLTRPRCGGKALDAALATGVGMALRPRSKKRQWVGAEGDAGRPAAAPC